MAPAAAVVLAALTGLMGMADSSQLPPVDLCAFLLCLSAFPELANTFAFAFCLALYFLCELSADPLERVPLPVHHGESYSLLGCQCVEISCRSASMARGASIEVTAAETGTVVSLGGSLLRSKVWPVYQGELGKSMPLASLPLLGSAVV